MGNGLGWPHRSFPDATPALFLSLLPANASPHPTQTTSTQPIFDAHVYPHKHTCRIETMPFLFSYVCDLLQCLEDNRLARPGLKPNATIIREWFRGHQARLCHGDNNSAALLSALLPEKRTDRVYLIREKKLQTIIGRALGLGISRIAQLARWTNPDARIDLAGCVESILKETPNPVSPNPVTVEEIDELLHRIAATCRFSSPAVRSSAAGRRLADYELALGELFIRLSARDAKWLTRLILKNYEPVVLDQQVVLASYHPHLPAILKVQDDLVVAGRILDSHSENRTAAGCNELAPYLKPTLGVKIGRQTWFKGRSIKHCLSMLQGRISCEEKVDGEYCQIHIDLSKGHDCIQIFSKSGKDSTRDRFALHEYVLEKVPLHYLCSPHCATDKKDSAIRKSLQLGQPSCPVKQGCILEGELVVYSDKTGRILDFHKIRKHVSRSGSFFGTDKDSQPHPWEHLMIVYYDVLMIDNESLLAVKHSERFQALQKLITAVPGRSALVKRQIIDCSRRSAASDLRRAFAECITSRGEGLVLKPDDPYFDFSATRRPYSGCIIKLKKEYVGHFGDVGDFALVAARCDPAKYQTYNIPGLKWTHFYVGCLENKDEVQRFGKPPRFVVTNVVELSRAQLEAFTSVVNPHFVRPEDNTAICLRIEPGIDNGKRPSVVFPEPPVVDLRCFSFQKGGNAGFWSPRFPSVTKFHSDRTYHDTISFEELQEMAIKEKEMPPPEDSQELLGWIAALERAEAALVNTSSQSTVSTVAAPASPPTTRSSQQLSPVPSSPIPTTAKRSKSDARVGQETMSQTSSASLNPGSSHASPVDTQQGPSRGQERLRDTASYNCAEGVNKILERSWDQFDPTAQHAQDIGIRRFTSQSIPSADVHAAIKRRNTGPDSPLPRLPTSVSLYLPKRESQVAEHDTARHSLSFHEELVARPSGPSTLTEPSTTTSSHGDAGIQAAENPTDTPPPGKCRYLPESCKLATFSILLSPCIADFPWVTEDLLFCHGVTDFIRDPKTWRDAQQTTTVKPENQASSNTTGSVSAGGSRRRKKIVLVDARRREATEAFLRSIESLQLKRRNGDREYVAVYDWRVLESLWDEERKCSVNGESVGSRFDLANPHGSWRRFWVGLV
ncbi:hypothetical protein VTK26DRAFT_2126 [Humicola hyalothermophila]